MYVLVHGPAERPVSDVCHIVWYSCGQTVVLNTGTERVSLSAIFGRCLVEASQEFWLSCLVYEGVIASREAPCYVCCSSIVRTFPIQQRTVLLTKLCITELEILSNLMIEICGVYSVAGWKFVSLYCEVTMQSWSEQCLVILKYNTATKYLAKSWYAWWNRTETYRII
jgi:hypothetical protein